MNTILKFMIVLLLSSCTKDDNSAPETSLGSNMLLIGNSFFRPYAEKLNAMAVDAGLKIIMQLWFFVEEIIEDPLIFGTTLQVKHIIK